MCSFTVGYNRKGICWPFLEKCLQNNLANAGEYDLLAFKENGTKKIDTMPLFRGWEMAREGI